MSVQVVVADPNSHAGLLRPVVAEGDAALHAFFAKRAIVIVHEQQTGSGVARHVDIRPAVLIQIGGDYSHAIGTGGLRDARLSTDVGERSIPVIAIQGVLPHG